jgi:hypothetical protein
LTGTHGAKLTGDRCKVWELLNPWEEMEDHEHYKYAMYILGYLYEVGENEAYKNKRLYNSDISISHYIKSFKHGYIEAIPVITCRIDAESIRDMYPKSTKEERRQKMDEWNEKIFDIIKESDELLDAWFKHDINDEYRSTYRFYVNFIKYKNDKIKLLENQIKELKERHSREIERLLDPDNGAAFISAKSRFESNISVVNRYRKDVTATQPANRSASESKDLTANQSNIAINTANKSAIDISTISASKDVVISINTADQPTNSDSLDSLDSF